MNSNSATLSQQAAGNVPAEIQVVSATRLSVLRASLVRGITVAGNRAYKTVERSYLCAELRLQSCPYKLNPPFDSFACLSGGQQSCPALVLLMTGCGVIFEYGRGRDFTVDFQKLISSPSEAYQEGLRFFMGAGVLNTTMQRVKRDLERAGIDYSVIGALALNQHGYKRFTEDIHLLMTSEGLRNFQARLVGLGYRPSFAGATKKFRTTQENVTVEIITTGEYPGDGQPKPVRFHDPKDDFVVLDGIKTVTLEKLVELKLASGMTAPHRLKDLADVQELIKVKNLEVDFADRLNPYVRAKFLELQCAVALAQAQERGHIR